MRGGAIGGGASANLAGGTVGIGRFAEVFPEAAGATWTGFLQSKQATVLPRVESSSNMNLRHSA